MRKECCLEPIPASPIERGGCCLETEAGHTIARRGG